MKYLKKEVWPDGQLRVLLREGRKKRLTWRKVVELRCKNCNQPFLILLSDSRREGRGNYCSISCTAQVAWYPGRVARKVVKKCTVCKCLFMVPRNNKAHRYVSCGKPFCKRTARSRATRRVWVKRKEQARV